MAITYSDHGIESLIDEHKLYPPTGIAGLSETQAGGIMNETWTLWVLSTFMDDCRALLSEVTPEERRDFDWRDPLRDPKGSYTVDCRINSMPRPLFVHALAGDGRPRDATIALHQFERWGTPLRSLAIFEDQESINRRVLAGFSDVWDKRFSSLKLNREAHTFRGRKHPHMKCNAVEAIYRNGELKSARFCPRSPSP